MRQFFIGATFLFIFIIQTNDIQAIDYALAQGMSLDEKCMVTIWVRGVPEDKRIIYEAKKENNICTVNVDRAEFEKHFKYCVLSGIHIDDNNKKITASFGGGPAGDREKYWFEWRDPSYVQPDFYCMLKSRNDELILEGIIHDYFYRNKIKRNFVTQKFDAFATVSLTDIIITVHVDRKDLSEVEAVFDDLKNQITKGIKSTIIDFPDFDWAKDYKITVNLRTGKMM